MIAFLYFLLDNAARSRKAIAPIVAAPLALGLNAGLDRLTGGLVTIEDTTVQTGIALALVALAVYFVPNRTEGYYDEIDADYATDPGDEFDEFEVEDEIDGLHEVGALIGDDDEPPGYER